jgi:hypothetical protein
MSVRRMAHLGLRDVPRSAAASSDELKAANMLITRYALALLAGVIRAANGLRR